ncbi:MAG: hypothetical protein F4240_08645 [Acidimicrobiia bacterium]|nr:hypothetical protein [Acidimicrobiia bacterium]
MITLAILALVASVMVWASPSSQAQANHAPFADAGSDQTLNPGASVSLDGTGSVDVDGGTAGDCGGCEYEWEVETGPYDWIEITNDDGSGASGDEVTFNVPSEAFVDKVADSDPQKYEIVVRLTVTDDDGATDSDTVSININQRPVADIQVYAGLRDKDILDGDLGRQGHFPTDAVIDGPGENGNRDNEWDIMEGAYLQLDGSGSTDENPRTGLPSVYQWTRIRPAASGTLAGYSTGNSTALASQLRLNVATGAAGDDNETILDFGDLDDDGDTGTNDDGTVAVEDPVDGENLVVYTLPDVQPNAPQTVFYQLTVCDGIDAATFPDAGADITDDGDTDCTGRTGATLIRIVVHDTSATPEVEIKAALTSSSAARGDAEPQSTVSQFTGVENQFIVDAGSTVLLTAEVEDDDQADGHNHRWTGATGVPGTATATVRIPADAEDGDTIDGSVTTTDATRISVTTTFQLLVGENTAPTAGGVPANMGSIDNPLTMSPVIYVHKVTDGFQNQRDGSTVMLRGVGNDADGDSIITAWAQREGPDHAALNAAIGTWIGAIDAIADDADATTRATAIATASGAALGTVGGALQDMQEPDEPLFELSGGLTDTVSFDVPNLENGEDAGTILLFTVIDSKGASDTQIVYVYVSADDDLPDAKAGGDQQVDPGSFVRLNGSASGDPDVGDAPLSYEWSYVGATMDPAPDDRSPFSTSEVDGLDGWILDKADDGTWDYIVNADGMLTGSSDKLMAADTAYPWFDAPDFTGFNNIKLTFRLRVSDTGGTDLDDDGTIGDTAVDDQDETMLEIDLNGDCDTLDTDVDGVVEANVNGSDCDTVVITVVNRFFSGNISGPDHCTGLSLGGPQTYPFDSDEDGVADTCSLDTTRRATVARQNALETLANLNPTEFRTAVNAVCAAAGFKQRDYGDDPDDLDSDACETERVSPPPSAADPATAEVFFSGAITGPDFCTNHSLGGARTYPFDSDDDGVADVCSLPTTRREAIARQNGLNTFIVTFTAPEQTELTERERLVELEDTDPEPTGDDLDELNELRAKYGADDRTEDAELSETERAAVDASITALTAKSENATRYSDAVDAACRALGSQDFGDAASALARDACAPRSGPTGEPLS